MTSGMRTSVRVMEREWLETRLAAGESIEAIARAAERSPSTVSYWLKKHDLRANGAERFGPRDPLDPSRLARSVASGATVRQIAREVDRSTDVVRRALAAHGLVTRAGAKRRTARAALNAGERRTVLNCAAHGDVDHVLEGRGCFRCVKCRAEGVVEHRRRIKRTLIAEAGGACVLCGYSRCDAALQFHHLEPERKAFHLSLRGVTRSWAEVRAEAAKCVLLCACCHAEVEVSYSDLPTALTLTPRGGLEPPNLD